MYSTVRGRGPGHTTLFINVVFCLVVSDYLAEAHAVYNLGLIDPLFPLGRFR